MGWRPIMTWTGRSAPFWPDPLAGLVCSCFEDAIVSPLPPERGTLESIDRDGETLNCATSRGKGREIFELARKPGRADHGGRTVESKLHFGR